MDKITINGFDELRKEITGTCLESELQWAENVENFNHLKNGMYTTSQTPTKCFNEVWEVEGQQINITKFIRQIGKWNNQSKSEKEFKSTGENIEYVVKSIEDHEILESI